MALTLDQQIQLIQNTEFRSKVTQRLLRKAKGVFDSYTTVTYNSLTQVQKDYVITARDVVKNFNNYIDTAIRLVASENTVAFNYTDNDIKNAVDNIFLDIAGVIAFDRTLI